MSRYLLLTVMSGWSAALGAESNTWWPYPQDVFCCVPGVKASNHTLKPYTRSELFICPAEWLALSLNACLSAGSTSVISMVDAWKQPQQIKGFKPSLKIRGRAIELETGALIDGPWKGRLSLYTDDRSTKDRFYECKHEGSRLRPYCQASSTKVPGRVFTYLAPKWHVAATPASVDAPDEVVRQALTIGTGTGSYWWLRRWRDASELSLIPLCDRAFVRGSHRYHGYCLMINDSYFEHGLPLPDVANRCKVVLSNMSEPCWTHAKSWPVMKISAELDSVWWIWMSVVACLACGVAYRYIHGFDDPGRTEGRLIESRSASLDFFHEVQCVSRALSDNRMPPDLHDKIIWLWLRALMDKYLGDSMCVFGRNSIRQDKLRALGLVVFLLDFRHAEVKIMVDQWQRLQARISWRRHLGGLELSMESPYTRYNLSGKGTGYCSISLIRQAHWVDDKQRCFDVLRERSAYMAQIKMVQKCFAKYFRLRVRSLLDSAFCQLAAFFDRGGVVEGSVDEAASLPLSAVGGWRRLWGQSERSLTDSSYVPVGESEQETGFGMV